MTLPRAFRSLAPAFLVALAAAGCVAGGGSLPANYQPDPALRSATSEDIESRFERTCEATQAKILRRGQRTLKRRCGCYASRTIAALDATEITAYRNTGVFNETARVKALDSLDACRLKRPV